MTTKYEYINESSISPNLICTICGSPFEDPYCCSHGHTFCRECITRWILTEKPSCPLCQERLTINSLIKAPHALCGILDDLLVKCKICGEIDLHRGNFDEHIQKRCPKTVISCSAADLQCPWTGQRAHFDRHLRGCHYEPMRATLSQLLSENKTMKDRIQQMTIRLTEQQNEIGLLNEYANQRRNQIQGQQNSITHLNEQIKQERIKLDEQRQQNQQLIKQTEEVNKYKNENQILTRKLAQANDRISSLIEESKNNKVRMVKLKEDHGGLTYIVGARHGQVNTVALLVLGIIALVIALALSVRIMLMCGRDRNNNNAS
ncbi:unnamed protein product [Adineta ricciae]|uniref:RING-type domain-containing protein n=1 Tax=Adineta ricciae TaxID=249248 RepID=A0A814Z1M2_ADIRI|nr:unnamed protein product [Adineta ricciae]